MRRFINLISRFSFDFINLILSFFRSFIFCHFNYKLYNPKKALEGIVELFENYVNFEEKVPAKYDTQTGKPVEFKWIPSTYPDTSCPGKFFPQIYLGGVNMRDPILEDVGLPKKVVEQIKKTPILLDTHFGTYVFCYEERDASGTEQGGGTYYAKEYLISVKKVSKIE